MRQENLKKKVAKGAIWTLMEKLSVQGVGFLVSMVLARLLTPSEHGIIALTTIFFAVTNVLVDGGFGTALVQKKKADDLDFNSVFYLSIGMSIMAYALLFLAAPTIAAFYETPILVPMLRVASVSFFFNAINSVQNAELVRKMLFHLSFRISLITALVSAICGVTLAFLGYGVWALIWAMLISGFAGCLARCLIIAWRPRLMFSFARLKPLFAYGWKMSASALLDQVFVNLNGILIGKFYTKADLAYVDKGNMLPKTVMSQVDDTLGRVSFPALVQLQDDKIALREAMRAMMRCSTFLVFPLMTGLACCSNSLIVLLFGDQWTAAIPYMMLACFSFALWPFHTINLRGIMAIGRSDVFLKLEIIKKASKLLFILAFFRFGVLPFMAACAFALGPLSVVINAWPNRKLLDYTLRMQILDVFPTSLVCLAEAAVVLGCGYVLDCLGWNRMASNWSLILSLMIQFVIGGVVFFSLSYVFRLKPLLMLLQMAAPLVAKFKRRTDDDDD